METEQNKQNERNKKKPFFNPRNVERGFRVLRAIVPIVITIIGGRKMWVKHKNGGNDAKDLQA